MKTEDQLKNLNDELKSIKTAYAQVPYNLILYTYKLDLDLSQYFISKTVIFKTEDGSNTIATIEGATYERMPYEGGAKFFLYTKQADEVKLHTMQTGEIIII